MSSLWIDEIKSIKGKSGCVKGKSECVHLSQIKEIGRKGDKMKRTIKFHASVGLSILLCKEHWKTYPNGPSNSDRQIWFQ